MFNRLDNRDSNQRNMLAVVAVPNGELGDRIIREHLKGRREFTGYWKDPNTGIEYTERSFVFAEHEFQLALTVARLGEQIAVLVLDRDRIGHFVTVSEVFADDALGFVASLQPSVGYWEAVSPAVAYRMDGFTYDPLTDSHYTLLESRQDIGDLAFAA